MNRTQARQLAREIPQQVCAQMLKRAISEVPDWTKPSRDNKGMSRGTSWNLLFKDLDFNEEVDEIIKYRIIREFEEYLPTEYQPKPKPKREAPSVTHQSPDFGSIKF